MTSDLVTWLRAQLDEDERIARNFDSTTVRVTFFYRFLDEFDEDRILAEIEAKRRIIELHQQGDKVDECFICFAVWPCGTLRALALPYANRPGYLKEWTA